MKKSLISLFAILVVIWIGMNERCGWLSSFNKTEWEELGKPIFLNSTGNEIKLVANNNSLYLAFDEKPYITTLVVMKWEGMQWVRIGEWKKLNEIANLSCYKGRIYIALATYSTPVINTLTENAKELGRKRNNQLTKTRKIFYFKHFASFLNYEQIYHDHFYGKSKASYQHLKTEKIKVMMFKGNNRWVQVGKTIVLKDSRNFGDLNYFEIFHGVFYLGLSHSIPTSTLFGAEALLEYTGSSWKYIGNPESISPTMGSNVSVAFLKTIPYVAYDEWANTGIRNFNGTTWIKGQLPSRVSDLWAYPSLLVSNNCLYMVAYCASGKSKMAFLGLKKNKWMNLGQLPGDVLYTNSSFSPFSFVSYKDILYVGYPDKQGNGRVSVMCWDGSSWSLVGKPRFSLTCGHPISMVVLKNILYVAFLDRYEFHGEDSGGKKIMVMKYPLPQSQKQTQ
jgi:hypothetical protein